MFERFTERARQVVVLAQEEARTLKHNYIGTEHILLGLLREEEGLAARVLESLDITVERVRVLYMNHQNMLIHDGHVGDGSVDEAAIHPREVIRRAMELGATALILVHNHPSGSPQPSRADIQITNRIAEAGRLLGIVDHDHVIIGREGHVSLKAKGLI